MTRAILGCALLLVAGCGEPLEPTLYVFPSGDLGTFTEFVTGDGETEPQSCAVQPEGDTGAPTTGEAFYVAWVLPEGVQDPAEPAIVTLEAACSKTTRELTVVDRVATAAFEAPERAECGFVVSVSQLNGAAHCVLHAGSACEPEPCPEPDSSADDDDSGAAE